MNSPDEQAQATQEASKEGPLRFVTELADEHDYWMSLTDAARITRTSEAMARRWVTSGRLPTKQEPVGINQRTRLVRASDVARIRPIIDPSAAITDDLHKLDLPSIPRQQMQIIQEQTQLSGQLQSLHQTLEGHITEARTALEQGATKLQQQAQAWDHRFSTHTSTLQQTLDQRQQQHLALAIQVQEQAQQSKQYNDALEEYKQHAQHDIQQFRTSTSNQFAALQTTLQKLQQETQQHLTTLAQQHQAQIDQSQHEFASQLQLQEEKIQQVQQDTEARLIPLIQTQTHMQQDLATMQRSLSAHQETLTTRIEQQAQDTKRYFDQQLSEQAIENATLRTHIASLAQRLEQVIAQSEANSHMIDEQKKYIGTQEQHIQQMSMVLLDEIKARELLSAQLEPLRAEGIKHAEEK